MATTYGTGTALTFTDATQRQVLELGSKIHYYNPNVTPIFSLFGMKSNMTPVPIFEWMEDEYMIKKSVKFDIVTEGADSATTDVSDSLYEATNGSNGGNVVVNFQRQAQIEALELGGVYAASQSAGAFGDAAVTHVLCVGIGQGVNLTSPSDKSAQFVGLHTGTVGSKSVWYVENMADSADLFQVGSGRTVSLEYVNNAGLYYDAGTANTSFYGYNITLGAHAAAGDVGNLADADYFAQENGVTGHAEGAAVGIETRKQVRRLKNCTQIFREPYTITGTAKASKHYGGSEMSRLQSRKLAKIKGDIEWAILTNGAISLDASSENPKRTFQGFDVSASAGAIKSLNGASNTNLQWDVSSGLDNLDGVSEYMFHDMVSGSMKKTVFCSNKWLVQLAVATRADGTAFYDEGEKTQAGIRIRSYMGPVGQMDFVPHPYLNGALEDYAVAIDPANFAIRPLSGRNMQLRKDIVKDGRDGQTDEWLMEMGVEIRNEQTHAILKVV
jgi:hypothetical protein